ncbi:hypothetical protein CBR_g21165 [Chara braunii]|uniref:NADP-dependent oxidoreductase domain-containing protein n=1 Tax=Chara braunii TaxID=69332 RepID=A0A388L133_CHABU|nr:hypothetical protein CBR_g21165 [Chara braunii]|eukprot:GBG75923.1 hypothetical protein CBR_g21165 [Chara braunii]
MGEAICPVLPRRALGSQGMMTSAQGLGCAAMSGGHLGEAKPEEEMVTLIRHAVDVRLTFFDTSDFYGWHTNEVLLGKALSPIRDKVEIATKFGMKVDPDKGMRVDGSPEYVRAAAEASLKRLQTDYIDLYYAHRIDPTVPIEVTMGELKKLVEEGKVKYLGLSEATAETIRRAHAVHPITAVQLEWSPWERGVEREIVPVCRELGIGIVSYSPLGRGFFSGSFVEQREFESGDFRQIDPRFQQLEKNRVFYERLKAMADKKGVKPGQLALAWVHQRGNDVFPIPGTTKIGHLEDNIRSVEVVLSKEEMEEMEAALPVEEVAGERYPSFIMALSWEAAQSAQTPPLDTWLASRSQANSQARVVIIT